MMAHYAVELVSVKHFHLYIDRLQELAFESLPESIIQSRPTKYPLNIAIADTMWCPCYTDSRTPYQHTTDYPTESHENQNITRPINNSNTKQKARPCKSHRIRVCTLLKTFPHTPETGNLISGRLGIEINCFTILDLQGGVAAPSLQNAQWFRLFRMLIVRGCQYQTVIHGPGFTGTGDFDSDLPPRGRSLRLSSHIVTIALFCTCIRRN